MTRYIFSILTVVLCSISAWAQDTFNPDSPAEPGVYYNLTVTASPTEGGSVSPSGKKQYSAGASVNLSAYANSGYVFTGWKQGETIISTESYYTYTIPESNSEIVAVFEKEAFNPSSPEDPSVVPLKHTLTLTASPAKGGSFNYNSTTSVSEGQEVELVAYPKNSYVFAGWYQGDQEVSAENPYTFTMGESDLALTAKFSFSPANPGNPGANYWNAETGELIIDDFTPGRIMDAVYNVMGGSSDYSKVTSVIVSGVMTASDFYIADNLSGCTMFDFSRTGGYTSVPSYTFDGHTAVSHVILPACVESISYCAFYNCSALSYISCYAVVPPAVESNSFYGITEGAVLNVLSSAIPSYSEAEVWKDFTILPLTTDVRSLEVSLPAGSEGKYKNMTLEITNVASGIKQKFVTTDRMSYTFNGLVKNTTYNVSLRTQQGKLLGEITDVEIKEDDVKVAFESLLSLKDVVLTVKTPDGTDVTSSVAVTWFDEKNVYLSQGNTLTAQTTGTVLGYKMELSQELGTVYRFPTQQSFTVTEESNAPVFTLSAIDTVTISGIVKEKNGGYMSGATVAISQKLNGVHSKSVIVTTDSKGAFSAQVFNDITTISVSSSDYVTSTISKTDFGEGTDLGTIELKPITGVKIAVSYTYTTSVASGETAEKQNWYSDYENISYSIYNETAGKEITQFSAQNASIVLLEDAAVGDVLRITASSKKNAFTPVTVTTAVLEDNTSGAEFDIKELGGISAGYTATDNASVVGILYNAKGELVKKYNYSASALSISNLADGNYTLITMGASDFFNSILKLSQLVAAGLVENTDYVRNDITVASGTIISVSNETIPEFDESKLYYTGTNTSFTVNKSSIVAGNYLTLKANIDFKSAYAASVSNVRLVVDLPESCSFIDNSLMVGSKVASYMIDGSTLTAQLDKYSDQVRFCVIPTIGGTYRPNAFVVFDLNGKEVHQPIGSAYFTVSDLSISVPTLVAKTAIPVSGTAIGKSTVEIYDNGVLIGETTATAGGSWAVTCELVEPYNLSTHSIYAKVTTPSGLLLQSETQECQYDMNAIQVSKVTMINISHRVGNQYEEITEFDFLNPKSSIPAYWYWPSYPEFTFLIDFTNNDPEKISNVILHVKLTSGEHKPLTAEFDENKQLWIARGNFGSWSDYTIPVNVSVDFDASTNKVADRSYIDSQINNFSKDNQEMFNESKKLESIFKSNDISIENVNTLELLKATTSNTDYDINELSNIINSLVNGRELSENIDEVALEESYQNLILEYDNWQQNYDNEVDSLLSSFYIPNSDQEFNNTLDLEFHKQRENGITTIYRSQKLDNIKHEDLIAQGFEFYSLTDQSNVYYHYGIDSISYIDANNKIRYDILNSTQQPSTKITTNASVISYLRSVSSVDYESIASCAEGIAGSIKDLKGLLSNVDSQDNALSFLNITSDLMDATQCAYASARIRLGKIILENYEQANKNIDIKINNIEKTINDLYSDIKLKEKQLTSLKNRMTEIQKESDKLYNLLDDTNLSEQLKTQYQQQIDALEYEFRLNADAVASCESKINKTADKILTLETQIGKLNLEKLGVEECYRLLSTNLNKLPSNLARGIQLGKAITIIGKLAGPFGCLVEAINLYSDCASAYDEVTEWIELYNKVKSKIPCENNEAKAEDLLNRVTRDKNGIIATYCTILIAEGGSLGSDIVNCFQPELFIPCFFISGLCNIYAEWSKLLAITNNYIPKRGNYWIELTELKCGKKNCGEPGMPSCPEDGGEDGNNDDGGKFKSNNPDTNGVHDPSGYVYEAVESNRLQGVTATCYYKETVEDMYGDLHEQVVLWNAAEYAQENPLFTDENGMYRWDVPQGLWQVKFEKEGYQTTYSEWLPVPPPQLEVNVGMTQLAKPEVVAVRGYEDGIEIDFSKFMIAETLNTELITVTRGEETLAGTIELLNEEDALVSKVKYTFSAPLLNGDKVVLTVNKQVKSYAGITMESNFSQEFDIATKPAITAPDSIEVVYGKTAEITVQLTPLNAVAGKKVTVTNSTSVIASVNATEIEVDSEGKATFTVSGELVGTAMLTFNVPTDDLTASVEVKVIRPEERTVSRTYDLQTGWNWVSVNVKDENTENLPAMLEPIKTSVVTMTDGTSSLAYDAQAGFTGELTSVAPEMSYKVKMSANASLTLSGKIDDTTISLAQGWNRIGYTPQGAQSVTDALSGVVAEAGDVIMGRDAFATYNGSAWVGTLEQMHPGLGYMYYSQSVKSFNYTQASEDTATPGAESATTYENWSCNPYQYADNMAVIATLHDASGNVIEPANCVVAAFAGEECRGIVNGSNDIIFLTVHGETKGEEIAFRIVDKTNGKQYVAKSSIAFGDAILGNATEPYVIECSELSGIDSAEYLYGTLIYPNPVAERLFIKAPSDTVKLSVMSAAGELMISKEINTSEGLDVSGLSDGVYVITTECNGSKATHKFLKDSKSGK